MSGRTKRQHPWSCITIAMAAVLIVLVTGTAFAMQKPAPVNASRWRGAIKGYDPVAYFTAGKPVKGASKYSYAWKGATWYFASPEHRDTFAKAPEKYAPQYGGYCAYAVSQGTVADIAPRAWKIVDGKLYLNLSLRVQKLWEDDIPGYITRADDNWPKLLQGML